MKRILVIGASGFVGRYLTRQLIKDGYSVRCVARNPAKVQDLAEVGCEIVQGDMTDAASMQAALKSMDAVYIAVHTLSPQPLNKAKQGFMDVEIDGLQQIIAACRMQNVHRVVYVTSLGVAPDAVSEWTRERWRAEQILLNSGLNVTVIRPGMIIGVGGQGFNTAVSNAKKSVAMVIGNGKGKFSCIAIDDLVYYLIGVLNDQRAYGQCYEVGNEDDALTNEQIIDVCAEVLGRRHPAKFHIPLSLLRFMTPLIERMAKMPKGGLKGLLDGMGTDMIGNAAAIRAMLPKKLLSNRQAVEKALL